MRRIPLVVLALSALVAGASTLPEIRLEPARDTLRIAVAGDTGEGADRVARGIARVHTVDPLDAIVLTGDTFYPCGVTSAHDPHWNLVTALTRVGPPVFPVLGNHDSCGKADPDAQLGAPVPNWRFPARQYVVRAGVADLVFLDTTPYARGRSKDAEIAVRNGLASSTARWRVVVGHHPVISSGYHGYFPRDEVRRMRELAPTLHETKTSLYICGHDHHLELIRGKLLYLVSGAGSDPIPPIKLRMSTVYPAEIRRERIGFAVVELQASRIRVRFYDGDGKAMSGWM